MSSKILSLFTIVVPLIAAIAVLVGLSSILPSEPWQTAPLDNPLVSPLKFVADRDEAGSSTVTKVGDTVTYTLILTTASTSPITGVLTDAVDPIADVVPGSETASSGSVTLIGNTLYWSGPMAPPDTVTITFRAKLTTTLPPPGPLVNTAIAGSAGGVTLTSNPVTTTLQPYYAYLPIVVKPAIVHLPIVVYRPAGDE